MRLRDGMEKNTYNILKIVKPRTYLKCQNQPQIEQHWLMKEIAIAVPFTEIVSSRTLTNISSEVYK